MDRSPRLCRQTLLVRNWNPSIRLSLCRFLFTCFPVSVLCSNVWARVENTSIMQCASFGASLAVQHFSTLFRKRTIKKFIEGQMCVFYFFYEFLSENISHSEKNSARYCRKCENVFV